MTYLIEGTTILAAAYFATVFIVGLLNYQPKQASAHRGNDEIPVVTAKKQQASAHPVEATVVVHRNCRPAAAQVVTRPPTITVKAESVACPNITALRKMASEQGIQWRDAYGKGKHMRKDELIRRLGL